MRQKNKTRMMIVASLALLLTLAGSLAYYVSTETAHNFISTGGVGVTIYELADPNNNGELVPFADITNVIPGDTYSKIPYVENNDTEPVWVRATIALKAKLKSGEIVEIPDYEDFVTLNDLDENWSRTTDAYYYYNSALTAGEKTTPFFRSVTFSPKISDRYQDAEFTLTVTAEATQVANNGDSAKNANWTSED